MARVFAAFREVLVRADTDKIRAIRRSDTRVYFREQEVISRTDGTCLGAFFLINPGTAGPKTAPRQTKDGLKTWPWGPLACGNEDLLPTIFKVLHQVEATLTRRRSRFFANNLLGNGYVQLLNLSYIKNSSNAEQALTLWRQALADKRVRDDVPRFSSNFHFVVFGWGGAFRDSHDGERVSKLLQARIHERVTFLFPCGSSVKGKEQIVIKPASTVQSEIRCQIKTANIYPCGARRRDERAIFPTLYGEVVGNEIGDVLIQSTRRRT